MEDIMLQARKIIGDIKEENYEAGRDRSEFSIPADEFFNGVIKILDNEESEEKEKAFAIYHLIQEIKDGPFYWTCEIMIRGAGMLYGLLYDYMQEAEAEVFKEWEKNRTPLEVEELPF